MKKKLYLFLACAAVAAMVLGGCGGKKSDEAPADAKEPGQEQQNGEEEEVYTSEDGRPPLADDLKELYQDAAEIYTEISLATFDADDNSTMEKNGLQYFKVDDDRFATYDEFQTYLEQYFTKDFVSSEILTDKNVQFAKGDDGALYFLGAGRGSNIYYAGHVFKLDRKLDKEIDLTATAYYSTGDSAYDGEIFYVEPENAGDFTTTDYHFVMLKEDGEWKFDDFVLFF